MTAEALKAIADSVFFFLGGETKEDDDLKFCLEYYNAAIEMFVYISLLKVL